MKTVEMKNLLFCGLFFVLFAYCCGQIGVQERKLREGNTFNRRLRPCKLLCAVKDSLRANTPAKCYELVNQNQSIVVTECVYKCLRLKKENVQNAKECTCINGVCIDASTTTTSSTESSSTDATSTTATSTTSRTTSTSSSPNPPDTASTTSTSNSPTSTTPVTV